MYTFISESIVLVDLVFEGFIKSCNRNHYDQKNLPLFDVFNDKRRVN